MAETVAVSLLTQVYNAQIVAMQLVVKISYKLLNASSYNLSQSGSQSAGRRNIVLCCVKLQLHLSLPRRLGASE